MDIELDEAQQKAVENLDNGKILVGDVGSGKSRTAMAYAYIHEMGGTLQINGRGKMALPTRRKTLYVITTAKKRDSLDWVHEGAPFGFVGDDLVVDSWNNISKYEGVKDAVFIFDEQRVVGSGSWVSSFLKITKGNRWILLSATPGDTWMDYIPVFIANSFYPNRTEFTREHVVYNRFAKYPKVDRFLSTGKLERFRRRVLVELPLTKHTVRHKADVVVEYDRALHDRVVKDRWHVFEDRPIRDIAELMRIAREVVNSDPTRIQKIHDLLKKHPKLIIFYNFNYELEILRELADEGVVVAEWNGHKHEDIPDGDQWVYLVQYTAGAEGWNCTDTDAMAFYSLNYSHRIMEQAMGRIDRRNTPFTDLWYYTLRSLSMVDVAIIKALRTKKNFNEKAFGKKLGGFDN